MGYGKQCFDFRQLDWALLGPHRKKEMEYLVVRNKMPLFGSRLHFLKEWDEEKGFSLAYFSKK